MKNKTLDPITLDTKTTLVNLANSLLCHFGVAPFHETIPEVDRLLAGHRKVALFLFDGMGEAILSGFPRSSRYLLAHKELTIHSVNPATTAAATTALLSGRFPIETGWLGWSLMFDELGFPIDVFPSTNSVTGEHLPKGLMAKKCPYVRLDELMRGAGVKAKASFQFPIADDGPTTLAEVESQASSFFQEEGGEFLYSYWTNPDHDLHCYGTKAFRIGRDIRQIGRTVKRFAAHNPDVLVLVIADHGLIDVHYRDLAAFPELHECLAKPLTIDGRCCNFFIKFGMKPQFEAAFAKHFPNFHLFSKEEVLAMNFFGEGKPCEQALSFLGDYLSVPQGDELLVDTILSPNVKAYRAHHAGPSPEEKNIALLCFNRDGK